MSDLPDALLNARAYPHEVADVRLIETHLSWVFLTGELVYKVKKPVAFDFVDFSTLALREHFCAEEVRCNRSFAPELYLGVVPIVQRASGEILVAPAERLADDEIVEYAVQMHEFDSNLQADLLLERGELDTTEMRDFGARLAAQHAGLPELDAAYDPGEAILDNFATLRPLRCMQPFAAELTALESQAESQLAVQAPYLQARRREHFVRECHGDLHLSNLARLSSGITAFDCLEFDQALRHIDIWCDAGFLFMDCCIRDRADLGYAFVDGYLNESGDYAGVSLLEMFAAYRSVVRAKIAALRFEQAAEPAAMEKLERHLRWPLERHARPTGKLLITCGLAGSGKSFWSNQLVHKLPAIRLRSDVLRKTQAGLAPLADSGSGIGEGLYTPGSSEHVYASLAEFAVPLLAQGETVIVDAACLRRAQRDLLYASAASVGAAVNVLHFTAPVTVLQDRISAREAAGDNPSEADKSVLDWQLGTFEAPASDEPEVVLDTTTLTIEHLISDVS